MDWGAIITFGLIAIVVIIIGCMLGIALGLDQIGRGE
jgi:uncharacterized membrane protein